MDRIKETTDVVKALSEHSKGGLEDYNLIKKVCNFFDQIKLEELNPADLKFLKYISCIAGIPHYYDMLEKRFDQSSDINNIDLSSFSAMFYESTLQIDDENKLHKYQKQIFDRFKPNKLNRFFLSASTSFGKTHLVFDIIKKMEYQNVVLIFPTIALLSENLEKLISDKNYAYFGENYKIHTLSEVDEVAEKNIFIYTPERFLSYYEKNENLVSFNFAFVDEIYKIDNEYIIDEETRENERDIAYRLAVFYCLDDDVDVLLAGPYIEFSESSTDSFDIFLSKNLIKLINYNDYEIVNKSFSNVKSKQKIVVDDDLQINYNSNDKSKRLVQTIKQISEIHENAIVYCSGRGKNGGVEGYAIKLIQSEIFSNHDYSSYSDLISHISSNFSDEWVLIKGLRNGIGIHHGLIPKYIQKEVVSLFNEGLINALISTTTITEGVNTSAKNLIVMHNKKGRKALKKFDAKNIAGRAGRFGYHYNGRVIVIKNDFIDTINSEANGIKHKNYDAAAPKDEIDLFYSQDDYLSEADQIRKKDILNEQIIRGIPDALFDVYKVVSRADKIKVYDRISKLNIAEMEQIKKLIRSINFRMNIDYDGFQIVLNVIEPIVKNQHLKFMIEHKVGKGQYPLITNLIHFYLKDGFRGSVKYHIKKRGEDIDKAISNTSKFIYNTLKYQMVKYLGVFNLMYKYILSQSQNKDFSEVSGIEKLLLKFEYNAVTDEGRVASDYGVPSNVLKYYENPEDKNIIQSKFDEYERQIFQRVNKIVTSEKKQ